MTVHESPTFHRSRAVRPATAALALALALAAMAGPALAWPDKPIKLITPSTPGGPPDAYARALADQLTLELGQPVVVENSPAVGGMVAAQAMARTPADGYTLLVGTAGMMTITPHANPTAKYGPADFTPICQGVGAGLVLASNPALGTRDFAQLTRWLKAQKTAPTYSSYAAGSPAHFLGYQLSEALQVEMVHVPYRSSPTQITDMIGGVAPLGFVQIATASPQIKAGKLIAYATTGASRSTQLPDVPTVAELGYPQLETTVWFGLSAPKGLPADIARRLVEVHEKILGKADFRTRMEASGLEPTPGLCGEAFLRKMNAESARWAGVVKATGFTASE